MVTYFGITSILVALRTIINTYTLYYPQSSIPASTKARYEKKHKIKLFN